jgi:uncharacterized protein (TIGR00369 family)
VLALTAFRTWEATQIDARASYYRLLIREFHEAIPHERDLGMEVVELGRGLALLKLPYRPELLGDASRGLLNTGVTSTLIDSACGLAVFAALDAPTQIATLDLRVDYLRPAIAHKTLHARAECYRMTRHIAFLRATVYQDDNAESLATSSGTFMVDAGRRAI